VEYWTIEAELIKQENGKNNFRASLVGLVDDGKLEIPDKQKCDLVLGELRDSAYSVSAIRKKDVSRNPSPPFITSTLQQEAWRKLRFTAKKTMVIAQQLYEGLPIGEEGDTGLITYMRTDSTTMAATAVEEIREYIQGNFSPPHLPKSPRVFTKKVKMAQEAHEAIRPTKAHREPDKIKDYLNKEQSQLYDLIWKRAIASQMSAAVYDTITVDIHATPRKKKAYLLQAKASSLRFPGFMALYIEGRDEEKDEYDEGKTVKIPELTEGELLRLIELFPEQFFTQPPPRYTEATLIKALEQKGIGRPSTYAPIISTIVDRGYVYKETGKLRPEEIGMIVNDLLVSSFPNIVDFNFTAKMEDELDEIAQGKMKWRSVIKQFYTPFEHDLTDATENLQKIVIKSEEVCPECGKPMVMKSSRYGKFLACSNYPECKGKKSLNSSHGPAGSATGDKGETTPEVSNEPCPICKKNMVVRKGRYGRFLACPDYPKCTGKQAMRRGAAAGQEQGSPAVPETTDEKCPKCGAPMVVRRGRFGKFLACSTYPKCKATQKIVAGDKAGQEPGAEPAA
jgi:DNA topoisomerase I